VRIVVELETKHCWRKSPLRSKPLNERNAGFVNYVDSSPNLTFSLWITSGLPRYGTIAKAQ
jgi:hypothetical protein